MEGLKLQTIELDPNKVYTIMVEVGDMPKELVKPHLESIKALYEKQNIKAIYTAMHNGVGIITINEILPAIKEW